MRGQNAMPLGVSLSEGLGNTGELACRSWDGDDATTDGRRQAEGEAAADLPYFAAVLSFDKTCFRQAAAVQRTDFLALHRGPIFVPRSAFFWVRFYSFGTWRWLQNARALRWPALAGCCALRPCGWEASLYLHLDLLSASISCGCVA